MTSTESPAVLVERDAGIVTISLNRPEKGNGISRGLCDGLQAAARSLTHDASVTAVILRANGPRFSVGGDIAEFGAAGEHMSEFIDALATDLHDAVLHLHAANAPVISAVRGSCAGAGIGLAVGADLVVAGESATFTIGYPGVGLSPDGGASWLLARIVGLRRAMDMILTNRTVGAAEAKEWGLVNEVVPDEDVDARALALARQVSKFPVRALGAARHLVMAAASSTLAEAFTREEHSIAALAGSDEAKARVAAFLSRGK
jgi:2-(1,2-epoxy-1,2-dihydrophenyl)acetyl-CoA isomerase